MTRMPWPIRSTNAGSAVVGGAALMMDAVTRASYRAVAAILESESRAGETRPAQNTLRGTPVLRSERERHAIASSHLCPRRLGAAACIARRLRGVALDVDLAARHHPCRRAPVVRRRRIPAARRRHEARDPPGPRHADARLRR